MSSLPSRRDKSAVAKVLSPGVYTGEYAKRRERVQKDWTNPFCKGERRLTESRCAWRKHTHLAARHGVGPTATSDIWGVEDGFILEWD